MSDPALIPVWVALAGFLVMAVFVEGGLLDQFRRRAYAPQPLVALICDMLGSDIGWNGPHYAPRHVTGVEVESYSVESTRLTVSESRVTLSKADRFRLRKATLAFKARSESRQAEEAARELAEKVTAMAASIQAMEGKVVKMERRA